MNQLVNMSDISNKEKNLFIACGIRLIVTICILYFLDIPIFAKIILIIFADFLDQGIPRNLFGNWIHKMTIQYQRGDKITDSICYLLLLFYVLHYGGLSKNDNYLLIFLLTFRLIGTALFFLHNYNRNYFMAFPNFFLEICLGLMTIQYFPFLKKYKMIILGGIFIYKILLEYYLHIYTPSLFN